MSRSKFSLLYFLPLLLGFAACSPLDRVVVESPDGRYQFVLKIEEGVPFYTVEFDEQVIIERSALGLQTSDGKLLSENVSIASVDSREHDSRWEPVYGERAEYSEQYEEAIVELEIGGSAPDVLHFTIRSYNEGVAFRYESERGRAISREVTEFSLPEDPTLWVSQRAQSPIYETRLSALQDTVDRPLLAQLSDSLFVALGEAALVDFARGKLGRRPEAGILEIVLSSEVVYEDAFVSPWRTVMAGRTAGEILENNYLLLNLNEPNRIENTEWIQPGKVIREVTLTTQGGMACVDFAAKHRLQYIEFDAGWYGSEYDDASDATTVTVDPNRSKGPLDLPAVIEYAKSKDIGVLLYVNRRALEKQLDEVLPLLRSWGVKGVKYGFVQVGSQQWTDWLHQAVRQAAENELMIDIHDEYRPTGYSRTYPNLMTQEGIRGDEESPPNSMVLNTLFTRMMAGAGDHTNCYFAARVDEKMGSHASQLAKAVCIYSPWQFLYWYDRPEGSPTKAGGAGNSERHIQEVPELTFFDRLPTVWDDTRVLDGYPGSHAVIARRSGNTWYIGALNGETEREFVIPLEFLDPQKNYQATIFLDDESVDTRTNVRMEHVSVNARELIREKLGAQRGLAMIIRLEE
ncbi:glycoside hydrolase family 97 protein [Flavilitoribacter nigricans]|uniref:Alpha-glucosidase n=1 Tax=Flavilitoribacter nigricans (strain ATCC 23147 / DSM 23189 / NBRC 102662 / NCIMB 1420 / SS-2) TaxID=1122177 RepID=A0A2D0N1I0_FLAN2|nr:glycoside hydrolase family 97 protein [Flavilitoribacter nigricans]PHN02290.1 alpha-glucosidase [Flavilitoribacter nigricans DSM 23189 = NBRC 102662]